MPEKLTLNDGTELAGHCILMGEDLLVYLTGGLSLIEGVTLFSDPMRTIRIVELNHGNEHVFEGYTDLYSASREYGNCNLTMKKVRYD